MTAMRFFTDQCGRTIELPGVPGRIISLVPSQTELLYDLGLGDRVCGITKFCVHPESWFRAKTRVGGTKTIDIAKVHRLKPDLIIANKEENNKQQIDELAMHYPVWISDVANLEDALAMTAAVGDITDANERANQIVREIAEAFVDLAGSRYADKKYFAAAYLIWQKPYMAAGGDTFIHDMMKACGFNNIFENSLRYPEITIDELKKSACNMVLLSSEPFPFTEKHAQWFREQLPDTHVMLVDGEMFSWYGSRLLHSAKYFREVRKVGKSGSPEVRKKNRS